MHHCASALDDRGRTAEAVERGHGVIALRPDRAEAVIFMRRSVLLRATPRSARNLAVMEKEGGNAAGRDEALRILRQLPTEEGN